MQAIFAAMQHRSAAQLSDALNRWVGARCVFVNPVDVTAPRWKRAWIDPAASRCEVHATELTCISAGRLRSCSNFDQTRSPIRKVLALNMSLLAETLNAYNRRAKRQRQARGVKPHKKAARTKALDLYAFNVGA
jgi:hypothetical protein